MGAFAVDAEIDFDPSVPAYNYANLSTALDFGGVGLSFGVWHGIYPYAADDFMWYHIVKGSRQLEDLVGYDLIRVSLCSPTVTLIEWADIMLDWDQVWEALTETEPQTGSALMMYTFEADFDFLHAQIRFGDPCEGIEFYDLYLSFDDLSLCCGVMYDVDFYFTKAGFQWVRFILELEGVICCGIDMKIETTFGVAYKNVDVNFDWAGFTGCFEVFGDVQMGEEHPYKIDGIDIYGWRIYCELTECTSFEILTALVPEVFTRYVYILPGEAPLIGPLFEDDEFQYIGFCFCGPGCCGGEWSFKGRAFFQDSGTLFGLTRVTLDVGIPVMANLDVNFEVELPVEPGDVELQVDFKLTF